VLLHLINNMVAFGLNIVADQFGDQSVTSPPMPPGDFSFVRCGCRNLCRCDSQKKQALGETKGSPISWLGARRAYGIFFKAPTVIISIVLIGITAFFLTTLVMDFVNQVIPNVPLF
jgi:hypothetical protein